MAPTQLQIKTKALQRLVKEKSYYKAELAAQQQVVDHLTTTKADEYELKKQKEVLADTERVLPDLQKKIDQFKSDLEKYVSEYAGTEDLAEAKAVLASV